MDYLNVNRETWNVRTEQHLDSEFYDVNGWLLGETSLKKIELPLLGDLKGKSVLHLMCHFGQDSLSMARMGASVTGLDLSPRAIEEAKKLRDKAGLEATFINGDLYSAPELVEGLFDLVFMSYGTVGWLPDAKRWADVVSHFIKPGGKFVFAEFHPALWMLSEDYSFVKYRYFTGDAIVEEEGTYTDVREEKPQTMISWNHGLKDTLGNLLSNGLTLEHFDEYDYSPYKIFDDRTVEVSPGEYCISGLERKLPLVYSLVMRKQ